MLSIAVIFLGIIITAGVLIALSIRLPLQQIMTAMQAITSGDYNRRVQGTDAKDEVGAMARAVEVFRENAVAKRTTEDELRQIFEPFGQVDRVSIMTDRDTGRSRGFGFVEMASNEDGEKAITALNGSQVGGRTLNVNEARPKTERSGGGGGGFRDRGGDRGGRGGGRRDRY